VGQAGPDRRQCANRFPRPKHENQSFSLTSIVIHDAIALRAISRSPKAIFSGRGKIALEFGLRRSREQRKLGLQPHGFLSFSKQSNLYNM
jgi:hypothetical protein